MFLPAGIAQLQRQHGGGGGIPATIKTNLVSWWTLNETSGTRNDSHGTNHLNSLFGDGYAAAKINNGFKPVWAFGYVGKNPATTIPPISGGPFSVAGWINYNTLNGLIIGPRASDSTFSWYLKGVSSRMRLYVRNTGGTIYSVTANSFGNLSASTWYFVYAYHNNATNELGISINDGTVNTASSTGTIHNGTSFSFTIGYGDSVANHDEFGVWKKVLSADEVTGLYNSGAGVTYTDLP